MAGVDKEKNEIAMFLKEREKMDEESRKRLTEFLGECWHEVDKETCICSKCGDELAREVYNSKWLILEYKQQFTHQYRRGFVDWPDYGALVEKLKEKGLWKKFVTWSLLRWGGDHRIMGNDFCGWLLDPARCNEIAMFLKEREEGE